MLLVSSAHNHRKRNQQPILGSLSIKLGVGFPFILEALCIRDKVILAPLLAELAQLLVLLLEVRRREARDPGRLAEGDCG